MKNKSFLGLLLFSCICLTAIAQETTKPVKAIYVNADQNILFDKLIDFVQNNEYFILSLDKQAGFIQAQKPVEIKKVFKPNERRTLNFVIRPINENLSQITLNIRCEESTGEAANPVMSITTMTKVSVRIAIYTRIYGMN